MAARLISWIPSGSTSPTVATSITWKRPSIAACSRPYSSLTASLWANVHQTISGFLYNEWASGSLLGDTTEEAFFVRCDRSTMS